MQCQFARIDTLNGFALKAIAIFAMTSDHIGMALYPDVLAFRLFGRLAMPIIAFLVAEGFAHTRSSSRYLLRLLIFAAIAQPAYRLLSAQGLNVLVDLSAAVALLALTEKFTAKSERAALVLAACALGFFAGFDWSWVGVAMVYAFHRGRGNFVVVAVALAMILGMDVALSAVRVSQGAYVGLYDTSLVNLACLGAIPFLWAYNGERGFDLRWFFYVFYPAHMAGLAGVRYLL